MSDTCIDTMRHDSTCPMHLRINYLQIRYPNGGTSHGQHSRDKDMTDELPKRVYQKTPVWAIIDGVTIRFETIADFAEAVGIEAKIAYSRKYRAEKCKTEAHVLTAIGKIKFGWVFPEETCEKP